MEGSGDEIVDSGRVRMGGVSMSCCTGCEYNIAIESEEF